MQISRSRLFAAALLALGLGAACTDNGPLDVSESSLVGSVLVECPTQESHTVTRTLGSLGGILELDGHSVSIPVGALLAPTEFTMTAPASRFVEVHITANGSHGFDFLETAAITISYARCTRNDINNTRLVGYKIDPESKALLRRMGGIDNKLLRRVTFTTDSLSGYAIAQ